jgi:flagella basal body P-ring formation protein FlgA
MRRCLLLLLSLSVAGPVPAATGLRVPADALVAVAADALAEAAQRDGVALEIEVASRPRDIPLDDAREFELLPKLPREWLHARVGVPVAVRGDGRERVTALVWFALRAPAAAPVYAQAYPRGTAFAQLALVAGTVDLARTGRRAAVDREATAPQRLRRAVSAGQAALAADFEAMPAVLARQGVQVESVQGPVRIRIAGRALADGDVGETISVLPTGADRPVRARVLSPQVVSVEN